MMLGAGTVPRPSAAPRLGQPRPPSRLQGGGVPDPAILGAGRTGRPSPYAASGGLPAGTRSMAGGPLRRPAPPAPRMPQPSPFASSPGSAFAALSTARPKQSAMPPMAPPMPSMGIGDPFGGSTMQTVMIDGVPVSVAVGAEEAQMALEAEAELAAAASGGGAEAMEDLMTGVVKTWNEERGFGFITPDGGSDDVFVHRSVLQDGESLVEGCPVMFDLTYDTDRKGFQATKCLGAVARPLTLEEAEAAAEGRPPPPKGRSKGGKDGKGKADSLYRPSFVEDPWFDLYPEDASHLNFDGERPRASNDGGDKGKGGKGGRKGKGGKGDKASKAAAPAALPAPAAALPERSGKATATATAPAPAPASEEKAKEANSKAAEEAPKATSIYDFFGDGEDAMMM
eukprot:TRINITY_DN74190_c0_g1_i1.p1 TRINITY_DN74190_c0_g1~~TRINITY_DN74190_c0_g1_i1.p1  ORF type:complete len:398 (-),score=106.66 TRINITY_DN74190_c0_g1_i1:66-1259(-)